jgi:hypothetical protein
VDDKKNEHVLFLFNDILVFGTRDKKILSGEIFIVQFLYSSFLLGNGKHKINISTYPVKYRSTEQLSSVEAKPISESK